MKLDFKPRLLETLATYDRKQFTHDALAGLTVGVLALPLAMAFAIASGMSPSAGIWTAIVAGFIIAACGGSKVQIGGPTGAFIPIVYGIVVSYGVADLQVASMLAGIMLLAMGFFRLGALIRFIPISVVIGFTNGIAVVIFLAQIKDFLGLKVDKLPAEFFDKLRVLGEHLHTIDLPTVALSSASLIVLLSYNRMARRFTLLQRAPGPLAVLVIGTAATALLNFPVETIGSRFGGIPAGIPPLQLPTLTLSTLGKLISPAIAIALLGAIESLLSARVADGLIEDKHNPNQELLAQGLANIAAPLFGGFAATGAIARTATNVKSGARTPVAGIVHALTLLLIVLVAAPLAKYIPLATLSAIVVVVSINMGEWHEFLELRRYSNTYRTILVSTFLVTVIFDLTLAVELGMLLACLFFIYRQQDLTRIEAVAIGPESNLAPEIREHILAFCAYGSFFFGSVGKIEAELDPRRLQARAVVLDMSLVIQLDTTGLDALATLHRSLQKQNTLLVLCGLHDQPASLIDRSGFAAKLGADQLCLNFTDGIDRAVDHVRASLNAQEALGA